MVQGLNTINEYRSIASHMESEDKLEYKKLKEELCQFKQLQESWGVILDIGEEKRTIFSPGSQELNTTNTLVCREGHCEGVTGSSSH